MQTGNNSYACTFCHEPDSRDFFPVYDLERKNYMLRKCTRCKAVFLTPPPSTEALQKAYSREYYGAGDTKFSPVTEFFIDFYHRRRAGKLRKYVGNSGRILDIGCGSGRFLGIVKSSGNFEIHGIELPGPAAERAAKVNGMNLKTQPLKAGDFPSGHFDAVSLFHVFEHLPNPSEVLGIIDKILRPGGFLMMAFPNIGSFQSRIFKGKWLHLDPPRHLFFFKPSDFKSLMEKSGYSVVEENYLNISNGFAFQQSILNCFFRKREILYEYLKGNESYVKEFSALNLFIQNFFFKLTFPLFLLADLIESLLKSGSTVLFVLRKNKESRMSFGPADSANDGFMIR